jgi:hypothetical protein
MATSRRDSFAVGGPCPLRKKRGYTPAQREIATQYPVTAEAGARAE